MDFSLAPAQRELQRVARDFAQREIAPHVAEYDREERFPREIVRKMGALGLMGGVIPEEYGGAGLDYLSLTLIVEELSRACHVMGVMASFPSGLVGAGVLRYGTEEQKRKYLAPLARGEILAGAGVTEPHSGTDVASMQTTVRREGNDYVIDGAKMWISNLDHGEWFLTFATLDRSLKAKGVCAFIVEKSWPGVSVSPVKNKVGYRPIATGELRLDGVVVPRENLVGHEGEGFKVAMCAVESGRLGVAARALGMTQACIDASVTYAKERVVFDQPIAKYQLIQSKITDMVVGLESARYLTYRLACLKDKGAERARMESSLAKMYATDVLMRSATEACQIHGAYSASDEYPVGRYFRDAKFFQIVEGTNELHRILIAEHALGYRR